MENDTTIKLGKVASRKLTKEEENLMLSMYYIDCEYFQTNDKKAGLKGNCPVHKISHKKTPDPETIESITELFPFATMQQIGDVFGVTREAIRLQYSKISGDNSFGQDRINRMYGEEPNLEILRLIYKQHTNSTNKRGLAVTAEVLGSNLEYIRHWIKNSEIVKEMHEAALEERKFNLENPNQQKCNRCHNVQDIKNFYKDKNTLSGYSLTCIDCSKAAVDHYFKVRQKNFDPRQIPAEKKCPTCKQVKSRKYFDLCKGNSTGLQTYCKSCMNKNMLSNKKRKQKFIDIGLDKDRFCLQCNKLNSYWNFALIRGFNRYQNHQVVVSPSCLDCAKDSYTSIKEEYTDTYFMSNKESKLVKGMKYVQFSAYYRRALMLKYRDMIKSQSEIKPTDVHITAEEFANNIFPGFTLSEAIEKHSYKFGQMSNFRNYEAHQEIHKQMHEEEE